MRKSRVRRSAAIACLVILLAGFLALAVYTANAPLAHPQADKAGEQAD